MYTVRISTTDSQSEHRKPFLEADGRIRKFVGHGTTGDVYFKFYGSSGSTRLVRISGRDGQITYDGVSTPIRLKRIAGTSDPDWEPFEAGETVEIMLPDVSLQLGNITKLIIGLDYGNTRHAGKAWHLDEVVICDETRKTAFVFSYRDWLAVTLPYKTEVTLTPNHQPPNLFLSITPFDAIQVKFNEAVDHASFRLGASGETASCTIRYMDDYHGLNLTDDITGWRENTPGTPFAPAQYLWNDAQTLLIGPPQQGWPLSRFVCIDFTQALRSNQGNALIAQKQIIAQVIPPPPLDIVHVQAVAMHITTPPDPLPRTGLVISGLQKILT